MARQTLIARPRSHWAGMVGWKGTVRTKVQVISSVSRQSWRKLFVCRSARQSVRRCRPPVLRVAALACTPGGGRLNRCNYMQICQNASSLPWCLASPRCPGRMDGWMDWFGDRQVSLGWDPRRSWRGVECIKRAFRLQLTISWSGAGDKSGLAWFL